MPRQPSRRSGDGHLHTPSRTRALIPPCIKCQRVDRIEEDEQSGSSDRCFLCTRCGIRYSAVGRHPRCARKAKARSRALTKSDADATIDFLETAVRSRRRADPHASVDAWLGIDDVVCLLRRVRRLWDKLEMPVHARHELADVIVRASLTVLDITDRYVEVKRKWSAAIGFEVQLPL
jgi:hypothetical protein